jgi:hypothetical protein
VPAALWRIDMPRHSPSVCIHKQSDSIFLYKCLIYAIDVMIYVYIYIIVYITYTRWFKYDRDYLCVNKSQFVPVIFEPPCASLISFHLINRVQIRSFSLLNVLPKHHAA